MMLNKNPLYERFAALQAGDPMDTATKLHAFLLELEDGDIKHIDTVNHFFEVLVDRMAPCAIPVHYACFDMEQPPPKNPEGEFFEHHYSITGYRLHSEKDRKLELFELSTAMGFRQIAFVNWDVIESITQHTQDKGETVKLLTALAFNVHTVEQLTMLAHNSTAHQGDLYWGLISTWLVDNEGVARIALGHPDDTDFFHGPPVTDMAEGIARQRGVFYTPARYEKTQMQSAPALTATSWTPAGRMPKPMHTAWKTAINLPQLIPEIHFNPRIRLAYGISGGEEGYIAGVVALRCYPSQEEDGTHIAMIGTGDVDNLPMVDITPPEVDRHKLS